MIYLNSGFFKPMFIILSISLLPLTVACWWLTLASFEIERFIVSLIMLLSYIAVIILTYRYSKSKKNYISKETDNVLFIYSLDFFHNTKFLKLDICNIVKIEYYKISSIRGWCMLFNYLFPQCVFITYLSDGKEVCQHIGYPNFKEISKFCNDLKINFVVK